MQYLQIDGAGFTPNSTGDIYLAAGSQLLSVKGAAAITANGSFSVPLFFGDNLPYGAVFIYVKDASGVQSPSIAIQVTGGDGLDNNNTGGSGNTGGGSDGLSNPAVLTSWQEVQKTIKPFLPWVAGVIVLALIVIIIKNNGGK